MPNIRIVPWQRFTDLAPWLYAADVLVIPPSLEPLRRHGTTVLPIKLFLYLAAGRVVLAPHAPDTAELLKDGVNAALVPAGDVAATVATLRALSSDPSQAERLAGGARQTAANLTWDARAERIEGFLEGRLTGPPGSPIADPWTVGSWLAECARWLVRR
jgi:glycosyltransferase involved in cell wall biosynthesis